MGEEVLLAAYTEREALEHYPGSPCQRRSIRQLPGLDLDSRR